MVDLRRAFIDLEVLANQRRAKELFDVVIGVEDDPNARQIPPVLLKRLRLQPPLLAQSVTQAFDRLGAILD